MMRIPMMTIATLGLALCSGALHAASLTVVVTAIEQHEGAIMLALFDAAEAYDGNGEAVHGARIAVTGGEVSLTLDDLPPGRYAIKLYHDANGNGQLDTNMVGLPIEGYGFSGTGGQFGPPPFDDAAFEIGDDADNEVIIRLR